MKRILIVCDDPSLNTGYARVGRFVAATLHAAGYQVKYLPCNAVVPEVDRTQWGYEVLPFVPHDRWCHSVISEVLPQYKPSLVMVFGEFGLIGSIGNTCRTMGIRSLYYMPVEGTNYPPHFVHMPGGHIDYKLTLQKFNYIVAYSQFGADNINKLLPGIVADVVPHQVNTNIFRPLDKERCLTTFFPELVEKHGGIDNIFIVGHVGRNQRRKGTDYVFQGFAEFLNRWVPQAADGSSTIPVPYLFLVTDPKDTHGYNIPALIEEYGLTGRVNIIPVIGGKQGPADNQMAEIINCFDLHLAPHRAEGFGLPVLEASACGVQSVTTKYASPAEFGADIFEFVKPAWYEPCPGTNTNWAVLDPRDIGAAIGEVYHHHPTKLVYANAVRMAQQFSEEAVAKKWLQLLSSLQLPDAEAIDVQIKVETNSVASVVDDYLSQME